MGDHDRMFSEDFELLAIELVETRPVRRGKIRELSRKLAMLEQPRRRRFKPLREALADRVPARRRAGR